MPSSRRFVLKDSHPAIIEASHIEPQGRSYDTAYSKRPGGIRIEEIKNGLEFACISITDDKPNTLRNVGRTNPWQVEAMKKILGSEEGAHKPLSEILDKKYGLTLDHFIDVSGFTRAGHALDTQGYIAHNDEIIVLAYRCTTTISDWLTNMTTTTSAWEHEDIAQGHSGYISCVDGLCCTGGDDSRPRVHTGFYNNFLVTVPDIQKHIDPLLAPDQPPRTLYVVGHSLGAGIATIGTCYFLLEHDFEHLPHRFVTVTAGGPRAVCQSMKDVLEEKLDSLMKQDKGLFCRLVRDKDCVPSVPPELLGFTHLNRLVYLTKDNAVLVNPSLESKHILSKRAFNNVAREYPDLYEMDENDSDDEEYVPSKYDKRVKIVPRALRDHMPDFYLEPLNLVYRREKAELNPPNEQNNTVSQASEQAPSTSQPLKHTTAIAAKMQKGTTIRKDMSKRRFGFFRRKTAK